MASTTIVDSYSTGMTNSEIKLKVTIQNSQLAKSTVRLNKRIIGEYEDSFQVSLGNANDIMGSVLYIDTTEADIDPDANMTSFAIELTGGTAPYLNSRSQTVSPGGYVLYTAEIALIP